ncbi:chromodomain-helicase-DNA-binding protein 6-like [Salvelinus alpinus]
MAFCVLGNKCGGKTQCSAADGLTDAATVKRNMKIQNKDKQMSTIHLLKHTPATAASTATDQNAQTPFPSGPLGSKDQIRVLGGGQINHCMSHAKHPRMGEAGTSSGSLSPCAPSSPLNSEEDDGGGGRRAKKKRKKKDKKGEPGAAWQHKGSEKDNKPKKKRQQKEGKELLPCKSKAPKKLEVKVKEAKSPKEAPKEVKRGRKPKVQVQAPPLAKPPAECKSAPAPPRQRGRKPREQVLQGPVPVEKKKKGKRKSVAVLQEAGESDDAASLSTLVVGGEESIDPLDNTKRRSGRQVKRRKYNEDLDFKVVDDDGETIAVLGTGRIPALNAATLAWQAEEPPEDEANIIEKILSVRTAKKEASPEETPEESEEFYVKYRNFSYLHCKWATLEDLEKDPRIHQKIKRFRTKQAQMKHIFVEPDEDLFNPDYIEVDRVLEVAITTDTETGEEVTHYLVKWCSLSYEEATWELQEDVDPGKIREFEEIKRIPEYKFVERPQPDKWQKLDKSKDYRNGNQLREYQLEGMNWLLFNWYNRKNCILADEMGLGKTIQSITFLFEMFSMGLRGPFLIIAPLSTITNWEREFRTWTEINVIVYHGSQISRQMIHQYEMYHKDQQGNIVSGGYKFHGVITTFEMIMADCPELKKIHWRCVVIDEAHRLKNRNCKLLEGLKLMNLEHKVLLTGTPLQNSVEELFSLLNFLEPLQFPSESLFLEEFGDLKTEEQVKKLQAILKPMMLRRLKDDVEKNLAPKEETIIEVELTNMQKKYYRAILEKNFTFLAKGANQHNMPNLINTMMELRKCCNHPYLIKGAEEKILDSFRKTHSPDAWDFNLQAMIQAAGKLVLIDKLLPKLIAGGHKVLVFSQMVRCLDILEDYLIQRRYTYERIDGRVRGNLRQAAIDRFCKVDSDRFVFLLCTRAGGLGINLTAADTCIIFDSDWNPQNDLQAQARCHRIGQSKAVKVYRLITRNSYEREMFDKASLKLGLDKAVLQDINRKGSLNGMQQMTKIEVEDLLRKGAYGALMDEEDEGSKFCEEDIDQILQRRTQTITIETEGKGSTFAKASFVSSGNRTDISLDDPNFWQKWAKIAELEIDSKAEKWLQKRMSSLIDPPCSVLILPNLGFQSPGAAMLHSFVERPKQRRHRCKDPTKLDVNSLTGEERVPVVHRSTGRRLGGAMAPAIKELSRWLDANTEYYVAPDWADVVKHSGFLPEGKFTRILTEPVCRDQGPRRRGRRPRSEMPKPLLSESPMGPLFMNGSLIGSMDLVSLQNLRNVQGIPLTGLMGFPHGFAVSAGEDAKNGLSMLPMMLHGIHGAPHMFSVQGLMGQPPTSSAPTSSAAAVTTTTASSAASSPSRGPSQASSSTQADGSGMQSGGERKREDKQSTEEKQQGAIGSHSIAAITTAAASSCSGVSSSSGSHLAFNPFLVPGLSHGLLYPHMFLPHGGIMALPGMPPTESSGSPKRKKKRTREEGVVEEASSHSHLQTDSGPPKTPSDGQTGESTVDQAGSEAREHQMEDNVQEEVTGHDSHASPEVNPEKSIEEERETEENRVMEEEKLPGDEEERESRGVQDSQ